MTAGEGGELVSDEQPEETDEQSESLSVRQSLCCCLCFFGVRGCEDGGLSFPQTPMKKDVCCHNQTQTETHPCPHWFHANHLDDFGKSGDFVVDLASSSTLSKCSFCGLGKMMGCLFVCHWVAAC